MQRNKTGRPHNHVKNDLLRGILIGIGWLCIAAGIIGIFLPILPTVPFLLLAAVCFSRSSVRFHTWLVEHKQLGPLVRDYLASGAVPLKAKLLALGMIWISFPATAFFLVQAFWLKLLLLATATVVTLYLLYLPTSAPSGKGEGSKAEP